MTNEFRYPSGEIIMVGDRVRTGSGRIGLIEEIIPPGPDSAKWYQCPDGGVGIIEDWGGKSGSILLTPSSGEWNELELIGRKQ
jgi:hypothetical protein